MHLKGVPQEASCRNPGAPFVIFGLFKHEHKKTVLNFTVQRNTEYEGSVCSKVDIFPRHHLRRVLIVVLGPPPAVHRSKATTG